MSKVTDQVIQERVLRAAGGLPMYVLADDVTTLRKSIQDKLAGSHTATVEYVVIKLSSAIEQLGRALVKELIDKGIASNKAVNSILKGVTIDLDIARSIVENRYSIGDIASVTMNVSRVDQFMSPIEALDPDFRDDLSTIAELWTEDASNERAPIIHNLDELLKILANMFAVRNSVVHDWSRLDSAGRYTIDEYFDAVLSLIEASGWIVIKRTDGTQARTQTQMNLSAHEKASEADKNLCFSFVRLVDVASLQEELQNELIESARNFFHHHSVAASIWCAGGSMSGAVYALRRAELADKYAAELDDLTATIEHIFQG